MTFKSIAKKVTDSLLNDAFRQSFLIVALSFLLGAISAIAAIPHFVKDADKTFAVLMSVSFVLSSSVFFLTLFINKYQHIWRRIFMAEIIILFSYLCYDGGPDGFLHIWVLLIPAFSFITFGLYEGFITSVPVYITLIGFFWWPLADYRKFSTDANYININDGVSNLSVDFRIRLTLIYFVCLLLGFFAELVRHTVAKRLKNATDHFEYVSLHDSLTGLANQNYLARYLEEIYNNKQKYNNLGCLFVDVDAFKNVNDSYGHLFGNKVLIKIAEILAEEKNAFVCRWGGDEYVICYTNTHEERMMRIGEKYRAAISAYTFEDVPDFHITVSVGAVVLNVDENFNFNHVLELADRANRTAKNKGKDNVSLADSTLLHKEAK